jgi:superfamily I DNA/RNA helicase
MIPGVHMTEKNDSLIIAKPKLQWSEFQKDIFRNVSKETGHLIVQAYAGSAKTTTLIESFRYVPKGKKIIALAFNKKVQMDLQTRAPSYILPVTFHSCGLRAIKNRFGKVDVDDSKVFKLVKNHLGNDAQHDLVSNVCNTVAFCKYGLIDNPVAISTMMADFDIDTCDMDEDEFIETVIKILSLDKLKTESIDFNDMCWMPYVHNLNLGKYQYVYIDEYQDLNRAQLIMAKKLCDPNGGRIIAAGDEFQAIYQWLLADTSFIEDIKSRPDTKILPLPVSYRCPKNVIHLAQNWVPKITCPDTAIDGEVNEIGLNELYKLAKPGCYVLSRTNAPLIKVCLTFIRKGIRANILGRDIGKQLSYLIKKSKKKQISAFLKWLEAWKDKEVKKLVAKNVKPDNVLDRFECLVNLCEECDSLYEVTAKITELFNDTSEKNIVVLSTIHKAKGTERDDVFLLRWTFRVWFDQMRWIDKPNEEANIAYTACTRTMKRLFIVNKPTIC